MTGGECGKPDHEGVEQTVQNEKRDQIYCDLPYVQRGVQEGETER